MGHMTNCTFYYATIAYHVGLNAVLGLPHPGQRLRKKDISQDILVVVVT